MTTTGLRYAYVTNGLGDHRLDQALQMLADNGYSGVGLTLDHHHLDPFGPDLPRRVAATADRLRDLGLAVVVETGARFVMDPRHKHEPTLLSENGRERRVELLRIAAKVAADLGAEAVSFWSGVRQPGVSEETAQQRLVEGCEAVLATAEPLNVKLAFEPEPGMFVASVDDWRSLKSTLNHPLLGLTLDVGHCLVTESKPIPEVIAEVWDDLAYVQIEDMRRGVHEHLDFGEGEVDFPKALKGLKGFQGLVAIELSRHSHTAHTVVPRSIRFLKNAESNWLEGALEQIVKEPAAIRRLFPMAARKVGEGHEQARIQLLKALPERDEIPDLYRYGDVNERRAIILSAAELGADKELLELARDAFRSNDPRLVTAAASPAIVAELSDDEVGQLLMKCVFMGISLDHVPAVVDRTTPQAAKMAAGFVLERVCAGRDVAQDVWAVIDRYPPEAELDQIAEQLSSDDPQRRRAASAALSKRST